MSGQEPMIRAGRGGAGNYYTKSELKAIETTAAEATTAGPGTGNTAGNAETASEAGSGVTPSASTEAVISSGRHGGRGGAGNFFSKSELPESSSSSTSTSSSPAVSSSTGSSAPTTERPAQTTFIRPMGGRGGAGNFFGGEMKERQQREAEEEARRKAEEVEKSVREEVEVSLQPPGRAHLGAGNGVKREGSLLR